MDKNIYDLLNNVEINLNDYEVEEMNELEQKRALNKFSKKDNAKKGHYKKYVAVASVALLSFGALGTLPTFATVNPTAYKIASMIGIDKDLADYTTAVNTPVTQKGITVGLGEVAYDKTNNNLIITTYISSDETLQHTEDLSAHDLHSRVYINGERLNASSSWATKMIDDQTVAFVTNYTMNEDLSGDVAIALHIPQVILDDQEYVDTWKFEFTTNGDQLASDTQIVPIDAAIQLESGSVLNITEYTNNAFGERIHYAFEGPVVSDFFELRGTDNLGNPVVFELVAGVHGETGAFGLVEDRSSLSPEASTLTLNLFSSTLVGEGDAAERIYNAVGDEMVINLQK